MFSELIFVRRMLLDLAKAEIILQILRFFLILSTNSFVRRSPTLTNAKEIQVEFRFIISIGFSWLLWWRMIFEVIESVATVQNYHLGTSRSFTLIFAWFLRNRQRIRGIGNQLVLFLLLELQVCWDIIPIVPDIL